MASNVNGHGKSTQHRPRIWRATLSNIFVYRTGRFWHERKGRSIQYQEGMQGCHDPFDEGTFVPGIVVVQAWIGDRAINLPGNDLETNRMVHCWMVELIFFDPLDVFHKLFFRPFF